jgi:hypothetical protein
MFLFCLIAKTRGGRTLECKIFFLPRHVFLLTEQDAISFQKKHVAPNMCLLFSTIEPRNMNV